MVASVLRHGGSGFLSLQYKGQRLACLQILTTSALTTPNYALQLIDPGAPLRVFAAAPPQPPLECKLYEPWGMEDTGPWSQLFIRYLPHQDLPSVLQCAINDGDLSLHKIQRMPAGHMTQMVYELRGTRFQVLEDRWVDKTAIRGRTIPVQWRFSPGPIPTHFLNDLSRQPFTPKVVSGPSSLTAPVYKQDGDEVLPEIEVARYALRTFALGGGHLRSAVKGTTWDGGGAEAQCLHRPSCDRPPSPGHRCGLYGTLTLAQQIREYPESEKCVAVFAAEGRTMLGTRGLRTERARIVAYWCATATEKKVFDTHAPEARHFKLMPEMLKAYGFEPWVPGDEQEDLFGPYSPTERVAPREVRAVRHSLAGPGVGASITVTPGRQATPNLVTLTQGYSLDWNKFTATLPVSITQAGIRAIAQAWGITLCDTCTVPVDAQNICPTCGTTKV